MDFLGFLKFPLGFIGFPKHPYDSLYILGIPQGSFELPKVSEGF